MQILTKSYVKIIFLVVAIALAVVIPFIAFIYMPTWLGTLYLFSAMVPTVLLSAAAITFLLLAWKLKFTKREFYAIIIASLFSFFAELLGEPLLGWYLGLWNFLLWVTDVSVIFSFALWMGIGFAIGMSVPGAIYLQCCKRDTTRRYIYIILIFIIVCGWTFDILGGFTSYMVTAIVWIFHETTYLLILIQSYKHFEKKFALKRDTIRNPKAES